MEHKEDLIQIMTSGQPCYPELLKEIRDYPRELYYIGRPELLAEPCVSIVGSRKTNQYGRRALRTCSGKLWGSVV